MYVCARTCVCVCVGVLVFSWCLSVFVRVSFGARNISLMLDVMRSFALGCIASFVTLG